MEIIDYAQHLIKIEVLVKKIHNLTLDNDYLGAYDLIAPALAELRLLSATLAIMQNAKTRTN